MRTWKWFARQGKRLALVLAVALVTFLGVRIYNLESGPPLKPWHTFVPHELDREAIDRADWTAYVAAEERLFAEVREQVVRKLSPGERVPINRYFEGSKVYPPNLSRDWNRTYKLLPQGEVRGAAVFLHGLTDSPYSLRHIARRYTDHGFVSLAIRLPGHGTVPAGLSNVEWEDWLAATRLAVRQARSEAGSNRPIHIIGFSNGGALAIKYALDAMDDPNLTRPERIVLISPMIGITEFARFVGIAALPALLPAFSKAAWLSIVPEFNPFKYNSFPVNGARQSRRLTLAIQSRMADVRKSGLLEAFPPVLTFQSVLDFTVSAPAVVTALHSRLSAGRSELVLFDINKNAKLDMLLRSVSETAITRLLPPTPRPFRTTVITNRGTNSAYVEERVTEAGSSEVLIRPLDIAIPNTIYSLSHVALPFPMNDGLYGIVPAESPEENFGVQLGSLAARGERGALIVSLDTLQRMSANPFFPYLLERIEEGIRPLGASETLRR
jgi:alpha-beta hydrolase superfamily lysophospholipase